MPRAAKKSGECIVCGTETTDRSYRGKRWHWRCKDVEECAVRRNAKKARPRPEAEVRAECRRIAEANRRFEAKS